MADFHVLKVEKMLAPYGISLTQAAKRIVNIEKAKIAGMDAKTALSHFFLAKDGKSTPKNRPTPRCRLPLCRSSATGSLRRSSRVAFWRISIPIPGRAPPSIAAWERSGLSGGGARGCCGICRSESKEHLASLRRQETRSLPRRMRSWKIFNHPSYQHKQDGSASFSLNLGMGGLPAFTLQSHSRQADENLP